MTMEDQDQDLITIKRKRSKRPRPTTTASSSTGDVTSELSGLSNSVDQFKLTPGRDIEEEEDMANCLILLANGQRRKPLPVVIRNSTAAGVEVYICKTCNRSFPSFQALGGHRASHKKPIKPPPEEKRVREIYFPVIHDMANTILSLGISGNSTNKTRVHECSICGAEFASGQALGGHMRRHRPFPPTAAVTTGGEMKDPKRSKNIFSLDLNLPAPEDHNQRESKFSFATKEQVIVFSASPLVHCHY